MQTHNTLPYTFLPYLIILRILPPVRNSSGWGRYKCPCATCSLKHNHKAGRLSKKYVSPLSMGFPHFAGKTLSSATPKRCKLYPVHKDNGVTSMVILAKGDNPFYAPVHYAGGRGAKPTFYNGVYAKGTREGMGLDLAPHYYPIPFGWASVTA